MLRYGIPYGPRMRPSLVIPIFMRKALQGEPLTVTGDGSQHRKFVYVEDLARAHVLALGPSGGEPDLQPRRHEKITILRIAETVLRLTGSDRPIEFVPARAGDYGGKDVSATKAARELGWTPESTSRRAWSARCPGSSRYRRGGGDGSGDLAMSVLQTRAGCAAAEARAAPRRRRSGLQRGDRPSPPCSKSCSTLVDEIIVVDDGSVDRSREAILDWAAGPHERPPDLLQPATRASRPPTTRPSRSRRPAPMPANWTPDDLSSRSTPTASTTPPISTD